jgi:hypothetical protein
MEDERILSADSGLASAPREIVYRIAGCYRVWALLRLTCRQFSYLGDYYAHHGLECILGYTHKVSHGEFNRRMKKILGRKYAFEGVTREITIRNAVTHKAVLYILHNGYNVEVSLEAYRGNKEKYFTITSDENIDTYMHDRVVPVLAYERCYTLVGRGCLPEIYEYIHDNYPVLFYNMTLFRVLSREEVRNG